MKLVVYVKQVRIGSPNIVAQVEMERDGQRGEISRKLLSTNYKNGNGIEE